MNIQKGLSEWMKMRDKRENPKISDDEYLGWKLNFMNETIKLEITGKTKKDGYLIEHNE